MRDFKQNEFIPFSVPQIVNNFISEQIIKTKH